MPTQDEQTSSFKEQFRFRAGVEATMSDLDRVTGFKQLRVRGMTQVRLAATLKATGLNIRRATAFKSLGGDPKEELVSLSRTYAGVFQRSKRIYSLYQST